MIAKGGGHGLVGARASYLVRNSSYDFSVCLQNLHKLLTKGLSRQLRRHPSAITHIPQRLPGKVALEHARLPASAEINKVLIQTVAPSPLIHSVARSIPRKGTSELLLKLPPLEMANRLSLRGRIGNRGTQNEKTRRACCFHVRLGRIRRPSVGRRTRSRRSRDAVAAGDNAGVAIASNRSLRSYLTFWRPARAASAGALRRSARGPTSGRQRPATRDVCDKAPDRLSSGWVRSCNKNAQHCRVAPSQAKSISPNSTGDRSPKTPIPGPLGEPPPSLQPAIQYPVAQARDDDHTTDEVDRIDFTVRGSI